MTKCLATISIGPITLEPIRLRDAGAWRSIRRRDAAWLGPWEATSPVGGADVPGTFGAMVRHLRAEAKAGRVIPWLVRRSGSLVGQITFNSITYGSLRSAQAGYWVAADVAGEGVAPTALALGTDYCWGELGLHRMEVNIRPENAASRRVVEKLGFRCEGVRERYLHINGVWADHLSYALTADEVPGGLLARWLGEDQPTALAEKPETRPEVPELETGDS